MRRCINCDNLTPKINPLCKTCRDAADKMNKFLSDINDNPVKAIENLVNDPRFADLAEGLEKEYGPSGKEFAETLKKIAENKK